MAAIEHCIYCGATGIRCVKIEHQDNKVSYKYLCFNCNKNFIIELEQENENSC